ncbi:MAG TPA: DUF4337 domain-containing protein [Steroidobacteraceae bacterium]|nr:DUF4337 domain-containing protein [Steroidobacteraceae bacterium]
MTEIEVKPEHAADPDSRRIGIVVGIVGILLSVVTIASHRAHTSAVIHKTESNDQWTYYQAKKIRESAAQTAVTVLQALAGDPARIGAAVRKLQAAREHYGNDAARIKAEALSRDREAQLDENRALRFDIGAGLLELGLVLCSLFFLARNSFFPIFGLLASAAGTLMGLWGFLS